MYRTYEYKLRPTRPQEKRLLDTLEACRFVYNWGLEDRISLWKYAKVSTNYSDQCRYLKHLKADNPWLHGFYAQTLQEALRRVQLRYDVYYRRFAQMQNPRRPRFLAQGRCRSFCIPQWGNGGASLDGNRLRLSKIGRIRIRLYRDIPGIIKRTVIVRRGDGWYALFVCSVETPAPDQVENPVGIDMGLINLAALSSGECIENPKYYERSEPKLRTLARIQSKRKAGGFRWKAAVRAVSKLYLKIHRQRRDFQRKAARDITNRFNPIFVENLHVSGMVRNRHLGKKIRDASWAQFRAILSCSAERAGGAVIAVEAHGTSQTCPRCGVIRPKRLMERTHRCECGCVLDRDVAAAKVILMKGLGRPIGEGTAPSGGSEDPKTRDCKVDGRATRSTAKERRELLDARR